MKRMEKTFQQEFGSHYINLRDSLVSLNFEEYGYKLTGIDVLQASRGEVPQTLMVDGLHFQPETYKIIAKIIKNKINDLDY